MAKTRPARLPGSRPAPKRPPLPSWPKRNGVWLGIATLTALVVVVVVSRGGDGDSPMAQSAGFVGGDFHSLVVDPTNPGRLFVGGHEAVSVSTDGGRTWSRVDSLDGADAMGWSFARGAVYVTGHPGISRSTDAAATFARANDGLPSTDVHAFGAGASALYAAGPANGVVASTDGGRSWERRTGAAGQAFFGRILTGPDDDQHLVAADARSGATESTDGGRTWAPLGGPPSATWVSRGTATLFVSGRQGAARSADGGRTWATLSLPEGASLVEADPAEANVLYAGVHDGSDVRVLVSRDGGLRWDRP